jgi:3-oxoacyl-[acyl-carrier protein] reductase
MVTGAARGIGRSIVEQFVESSHRIVAVDIDAAALEAAYEDDERILRVVADLSRADEAARSVEAGVARFGRLDALINNAALHGQEWLKPCLEYGPDQWMRLFAVNVFAIPALAGAARRALARSAGVIVNISSMVGYGFGSSSPYAVSKSAVNGMTIALAEELGRDGIRVVGLAPGFIATPTVLAAMGEQGVDRVLAHQAMPVKATPEDIAAIVVFLVSPRARLITGATVLADLGIMRRP